MVKPNIDALELHIAIMTITNTTQKINQHLLKWNDIGVYKENTKYFNLLNYKPSLPASCHKHIHMRVLWSAISACGEAKERKSYTSGTVWGTWIMAEFHRKKNRLTKNTNINPTKNIPKQLNTNIDLEQNTVPVHKHNSQGPSRWLKKKLH